MSAEASESHRQAMEIAGNAVASQLAIGKSKKSIVHQLVKNHWPEDWAVKLVNDVDENLGFYLPSSGEKVELAAIHKARMLRGLVFTIVSVLFTAIAYITGETGTTFVLLWGTFILCFLFFFAGFVGWARNS